LLTFLEEVQNEEILRLVCNVVADVSKTAFFEGSHLDNLLRIVFRRLNSDLSSGTLSGLLNILEKNAVQIDDLLEVNPQLALNLNQVILNFLQVPGTEVAALCCLKAFISFGRPCFLKQMFEPSSRLLCQLISTSSDIRILMTCFRVHKCIVTRVIEKLRSVPDFYCEVAVNMLNWLANYSEDDDQYEISAACLKAVTSRRFVQLIKGRFLNDCFQNYFRFLRSERSGERLVACVALNMTINGIGAEFFTSVLNGFWELLRDPCFRVRRQALLCLNSGLKIPHEDYSRDSLLPISIEIFNNVSGLANDFADVSELLIDCFCRLMGIEGFPYTVVLLIAIFEMFPRLERELLSKKRIETVRSTILNGNLPVLEAFETLLRVAANCIQNSEQFWALGEISSFFVCYLTKFHENLAPFVPQLFELFQAMISMTDHDFAASAFAPLALLCSYYDEVRVEVCEKLMACYADVLIRREFVYPVHQAIHGLWFLCEANLIEAGNALAFMQTCVDFLNSDLEKYPRGVARALEIIAILVQVLGSEESEAVFGVVSGIYTFIGQLSEKVNSADVKEREKRK
jgi:hypothetical protein